MSTRFCRPRPPAERGREHAQRRDAENAANDIRIGAALPPREDQGRGRRAHEHRHGGRDLTPSGRCRRRQRGRRRHGQTAGRQRRRGPARPAANHDHAHAAPSPRQMLGVLPTGRVPPSSVVDKRRSWAVPPVPGVIGRCGDNDRHRARPGDSVHAGPPRGCRVARARGSCDAAAGLVAGAAGTRRPGCRARRMGVARRRRSGVRYRKGLVDQGVRDGDVLCLGPRR